MLTELIVRTYKGLAELALWVLIGIGAIVGYSLGSAANFPLLGLVVGTVGTFLFLAIFLGAALLIDDIHTRVAGIEKKLKADHSSAEADPPASRASDLSPVRGDKLAAAMSGLDLSAAEIASQLESRGVTAEAAATQAVAAAFRGREGHVKSAKQMAKDGYRAEESAARLVSQGVSRADAEVLVQYAMTGTLGGNPARSDRNPTGSTPRHAPSASNSGPSHVHPTSPRRVYCRSCGQAQEEGAWFCESCGESLHRGAEAAV